MTKPYYPQIFDELEDIRNYMDLLFQQIQEKNPVALLPVSCEPSRKLLPGVVNNLEVTVHEYNDEVVITAEMVPGNCKNYIKIDLLHPFALKISCLRRQWKNEERKECIMCEHSFGYISQIIPLPSPVIEEGSTAFCKKNRLEIHLRKQ